MLRAAVIGAGVAAIVASNLIASNDTITRQQRYLWLTGLGFVVLYAVGVGFDIAQPFTKRRPLILRLGRPRPELGAPISPPVGAGTDQGSVRGVVRPAPLFVVLAVSAIGVLISATIGYALARTASSIGGLVIYFIQAAALWGTARSLVRLFTRGNALRVDQERARLGSALGYWPPLNVDRSSVVAFQGGDGFVAIVTDDQRFDLDETWFESELAGGLSAAWPEVPWHRMPRSQAPLRLPWWGGSPAERDERPAGPHDLESREQP